MNILVSSIQGFLPFDYKTGSLVILNRDVIPYCPEQGRVGKESNILNKIELMKIFVFQIAHSLP